ncbi:MAG: hypothetical protein IPO78_04840 [Saprospiraceae bacterium]|nr:hypothetical protein [Saprospiraceae bacterium]
MKQISIQALRGPNIHSINPYQLIHLRIDLSEHSELSIEALAIIEKQLTEILTPVNPKLDAIRFQSQLDQASDNIDKLALCIGSTALKLEQEIGEQVQFVKVLKTLEPGVYAVLFEYKNEKVGKLTAQIAFELVENLLHNKEPNIEDKLNQIRSLKSSVEIHSSLRLLLDEADRQNIPIIPLYENEFFQLGYGKNQKRISKTFSDQTNLMAYLTVSNRNWMTEQLYESSIPFIKNPKEFSEYPKVFQILILNYNFKVALPIIQGLHSMELIYNLNAETKFRVNRICHILGISEGEIFLVGDHIEDPKAEVLKIDIAPDLSIYTMAEEASGRKELMAAFMQTLFPKPEDSRIPVIGVSGTNGKTTTTRLIAHIIQLTGIRTGFTTSDGVYVDGIMVEKGDTTGPGSAASVLRDPTVEYAILETARGGILRAGLAYRQCDTAVITNITADHLGLSDVHTLEELSKVKGLVAQTVKADGFAVLNLENEYTYRIGQQTSSQVAYFSLTKNHPELMDHINQGKFAAYQDEGEIILVKNKQCISLIDLKNVPVSFGGRVQFMVANVLAASLACFVQGFEPDQIARGLKSFFPSPDQTPGRLNIFEFPEFKVMIDFAHNPEGFTGVRDFLQTIDSPYKIGIITGTGDRPDESIKQLGFLSAEMFDHIIIHQAKFLRGRKANAIVNLLKEGIKECPVSCSVEYLPDEIEPLKYAMKLAKKNAFITALSDVLNDPIELIRAYQKDPGALKNE